MSEPSMAAPEVAVIETHPVPESLEADRRMMWGGFGKLLFGNVVAIAVVLILMAVFLV
jgi:hypothetical protein